MLMSMLRSELHRKRSIHLTLLLFIIVASLLMASGARMLVELTTSIGHFFSEAKAPHVVQMHSGDLEVEKISKWALQNELVDQFQIVEMLNVEGSQLYLRGEAEKESVMDVSFVTQNEQFDYLLNLQGEKVQVNEGFIAVPVYYQSKYQLKPGDLVKLETARGSETFKISDFVRDVQMNPALVHSKRLVISPQDYESLSRVIHEREYLLEFQLHEAASVQQFTTQLQNSAMPQQGPLVDYALFQLLNGLGDGLIAAVIILISMIVSLIAILCIRLTMLATIEEDYREIGVLKAIGISAKQIKLLYMGKYVLLSCIGGVFGYISSFAVDSMFTENITLYMGSAPKTSTHLFIPIAASGFVIVMILLFSYIVLRRFDRLSAVEAINLGTFVSAESSKRYFSIHKSRRMSVPLRLALQDGWQRLRLFSLIFFVFAISTFIVIVPVNFYNTLKSPTFISYMGIGKSDLRIDLRYGDEIEQRFALLAQRLEKDDDVKSYGKLITSQFKIKNDEGSYDNFIVETGDIQAFPLQYMKGRSPLTEGEIAISYGNSKELNKGIGDEVDLLIDGEDVGFIISGIYQDITNGGRSAKGLFQPNMNTILWYVVSLDLWDIEKLPAVTERYEAQFPTAKVTNIQGYIEQTLGGTVEQLELLVMIATLIAFFLSLLITALFMKMLIAKDRTEIATLRSIGFSVAHIRLKYVSVILLVLTSALIVGTIGANTFGEALAGLAMGLFGGANISFVIDPLQAYIWNPLLLLIVVGLTVVASLASIRKTSFVQHLVN